jgi:hypothetical protein
MGPPPTWRGRFLTRWWSAAKPRGRSAWWSGLHSLSPPTRASPPRVDAWQPWLRPNHLKPWLAGQGVWPTSQPLGPHGLGLARLVHMPITPRGDDDFDIWLASLCHPLKCSDLVRKFLKSNNTKIMELG